MVDIIASRAAAFRLTWIIAALMVPILFFGYFMAASLLNESSLARNEANGAELIHLLIPVYVDAAGYKVNAENAKQLLKNGKALAQAIGVASAFSNLEDILNTPQPHPGAVFASSREIIVLISERSEMILDAEPETYNLAAASSENLPNLVMAFKDLEASAKHFETSSQSNPEGLAQLLLDTGKLSSAGDRVVANLKAAAGSSSDDQAYRTIANTSSQIRFRVSGFSADLRKSFMHPETLASSGFLAATHMTGPVLVDYRSLWSQTNARFSFLMEQRQNALAKKISYTILVAIASIVLGLGLAIAMFKSTLKRLDGVEAAKKEADTARIDAEQMTDRLSDINEDMVRMNQELGNNMQMLKDAQDALVKKGRMEQMGQLTATIAHELRNPLGAVRTSAFLIERKIKGKGIGVESQLLRINNGITRCDNIITQLLDFSRSKQIVARAADFDQWLEKIIEEEAKLLPSAVAIDCLLGLDGREVPFDPSRLQRAIINLVSNASEAMVGNGEDPSRFAVAEPRISISTKIVGELAEITVKDNGPGISPENLTKIREPLFTTKSFGTGLGLPAVEQIASQHGGTLEIESELGKGAAFIIRLPLTVAIEEAA
jgi:signal transduction histidine kinase